MKTQPRSTRLFVLIGAAAIALTGVGPCTDAAQAPAVRAISPSEAYGLLRNDFAIVIDIRELASLREGVVYSSKNNPLSTLATPEAWSQFVSGLPKEKQILVIGDDRTPARPIAERLVHEGIKALDLGRYQDWVRAALPIKRP